MRLTDGKRTVEITMCEWDGYQQRYTPDWSNDFFAVKTNEDGIGVVDDVDYCINQAHDWQDGVGDFAADAEPYTDWSSGEAEWIYPDLSNRVVTVENVPIEKLVTVYHNGQRERMTYEQICHDLEMNPFVHFVKVTPAHTIGFTAGKPSEINALFFNCVREGYKVSKALVECVYQRGGQAQAFLEAQRIDNIPTLNWTDKLEEHREQQSHEGNPQERESVLGKLNRAKQEVAAGRTEAPAVQKSKDDPAL